VDAASLRYLNRLSDLLFVLARVFARAQTGQELLWQRKRNTSADRDAGSGETSDQ
jgi:cob(I)alamin adenosyltransferase